MVYDELLDFDEKRKFVADFLHLAAMHDVAVDSDWNCLEVGGEGGMLAAMVSSHVRHVTCTDVVNFHGRDDGRFVSNLRDKLQRNGVDVDWQRIDFLCADAQDLPFRSDHFDLTFSQNAFEHIPDPELALREAMRVTRPGGYVYLQFDPVWTADSGSHFLHRIGEPWLHLLEDDDAIGARMAKAGADDAEISSYRNHMNRRPSTYYLETIPRVVAELGGEVLIMHHWSGCVDDAYDDHPNRSRAAIALGLDPAALMIRGFRFLIRTPIA